MRYFGLCIYIRNLTRKTQPYPTAIILPRSEIKKYVKEEGEKRDGDAFP